MSPLHVQPVGAGDGSPAHYLGPMGLGRDGIIEAMPQFWGNATVPRQCHKSTQVDTRMRQSCPDMDVCFFRTKIQIFVWWNQDSWFLEPVQEHLYR